MLNENFSIMKVLKMIIRSLAIFVFLQATLVFSDEIERKHIALFSQNPNGFDEKLIASRFAKATKLSKEVENFWRYYAIEEPWDIVVKPILLISDCNPITPTWCKSEIKKILPEIKAAGFDPNYFHINSYYNYTEFAGMGQRPGQYSMTTVLAQAGTAMQELGHNFNLGHAGSSMSGNWNERADSSSVMCRSFRGSTTLNSPNLVQLGLVSGSGITNIDRTQQILLAPIELSIFAVHDQEEQNVILKTSSNSLQDIYISLRKSKGTHYLAYFDEETIFVHKVIASEKTDLLKTLMPGNNTTLSNGVRLEYLEYIDETAKINLIFPGDPAKEIQEVDLPTALPDYGIHLNETHNGIWYTPDFEGQGLDIQVRDGRMILMWYTFNEQNEFRRYYIGYYDLNGKTDEFTLWTTDNGTFQTPETSKLVRIGTGRLAFFNNTKGVFLFNTKEHGRGSFLIEALGLSNKEQSGVWVDRVNEGFSFQFFDQWKSRKVVTGFWSTYGPRDYNYSGFFTQRWYMIQGELIDGEYLVKIYEALNGRWLFFNEVDLIQVGEGILSIEDINNMYFEYTISAGPKNNGAGTFDLKRLL